MLQHKSKIIPLIFKSVKKEDLSTVKGLRPVLAVLQRTRWNDDKTDKSRKELLLKMPPVNHEKRDLPLSSQIFRDNQSEHNSQQSLISQNVANAVVNTEVDDHAKLNGIHVDRNGGLRHEPYQS